MVILGITGPGAAATPFGALAKKYLRRKIRRRVKFKDDPQIII